MTKQIGSFAGALILLAWCAAGSYVGVATYTASKALEAVSVSGSGTAEYGGIKFANAGEVLRFMRQETVGRWFPWTTGLPVELIPLIMAAAFGLLGGVVAVLKPVVVDRQSVGQAPYVGRPIFGLALGILLFTLSFLLPALFSTGRNPSRTETTAGLALFGGLFAERTYRWIDAQVDSVLR